jgi:GNAT superfamily N-acetyltransferase
LLAGMNQQLLQDERHRNRFMTLPQLEERMYRFLTGEYRGVIFEHDGEVVAYALFQEHPEEIYLRQLFVVRDRRRRGFGRQAVEILRSDIWPCNKRLTVDVLVQNTVAVSFWRSVGFQDYLLGLEITPPAPA